MSTRITSGKAPNLSDLVRVRFDAFELDEANALLLKGGQPIALAPTPFAVLCALARPPGALVTKGALLDAVWGHRFVSDSVLKTAVSELRTALGDDARRPRYIETVSRRGYRFIAPATALPTAESLRASDLVAGALRAAPLTGRVKELARLWAAWERACRGKRTVVWVAGDAGVGKTALVDHCVSALGDAATACGQCVEQYGTGEPYLPILEALAQLCRNDDTVPALLRNVAPSWLLQLPWLSTAEERDALRRELAGVRQERMLREMGEFFDRYTDQRPLLLVTEDLHWSDQATIQLMDHIARRRAPGRLMWLATFRLAEIIALDHPLKAVRRELQLHGLCEEIVLDPFSEEEVAEYMAKLAPPMAASEQFVRALHERTDGLPLFVADLANEFLARPALDDFGAAAPLQLGSIAIPENLAGIIDHYIAGLTSEQRVVLEAAAVGGVEFRVNTVAAALERDAAYVASVCDALARGYLWLRAPPVDGGDESNPRYRFRHSLFREVLYERIGTLARRQLHCRTGAALERQRAEGASVAVTELAMHYERGGEAMGAARYYAQAAESLLHVSPAEAMRLTEGGLVLIDRVERNGERNTLELSLATLRGISAQHVLGVGADEAKVAFRRAFALLDEVPQHAMRGPLLHEFGFLLCLRAEYAEALAFADHAEALWREAQDPIHLLGACIVQCDVQMLRGRPRAAREWVERGLAKVEWLDQAASNATFIADPLVTMLGLLAIQLLHLGLVEQARARLREARARARDLRQAMAQGVAIWFEGMFEVRLGQVERVAELAEEMQAIVDEFAFAQGRAACQWMRGWAQARSGDPREGYRLIRQAYEEDLRLGMRAGGSEILGYAADALVRAGDWAAAQRQLDEALEIANVLGERVYLPQLFLIDAAIAAASGESVAARESMYRALGEARAQEAPWLELLALTEVCKRDAATAEDRQALELLLDRLPEAIDTSAFTTARALIDRKTPS
jgi:DNA-binding winged helix-turn-helix (wHTH) protein